MTDETNEMIELEEVENEDEVELLRPSDLADELGVDPKSVRNFLRREFKRPQSKKNTSWYLTEEMAEAIRSYFADEEEDEDAEEADSVAEDLEDIED